MNCTEILKVRVSPDVKDRVKTAAERELLTESAWLKRLVVREIRSFRGAEYGDREPDRLVNGCKRSQAARQSSGRSPPMLVRLRHDDRLLLDARGEARGMRPATYASVLLRSHLRRLAPLPKDELIALKRSISELAAIGRSINQIARAANEGGKLPATVRDEFRAMLKICEALRDNTKALIKANETSWNNGYAEADL